MLRASRSRRLQPLRGGLSTIFSNGIFQQFNLPKFIPNPVGEPSVLPIQCPISLWRQAVAWEVFGIGGWYVLSYISTYILKFTVQAYGVCNNVTKSPWTREAKPTTQNKQIKQYKAHTTNKTNEIKQTMHNTQNKTQFHIAMQHGTIQHDSTQRAMI